MISEALVYAVDLAADTTHQAIKQPLVRGDKKAHTIKLVVTDGGTEATLTNCTASVVVVRSDGATVTCAATITGNTITATIQNACYLYAGETNFYCRLSSSDGVYTRTLLWLTGTVVTADTDTIVTDTTTTLPSIDEFNAVLTQCQTAASTAQSAANTVSSYPYEDVEARANDAAASATAASNSAAQAQAVAGIIGQPGSTGDLLVKTDDGASWQDVMAEVWQAISGAGHTFSMQSVTIAAADAQGPGAHYMKRGTVTVSVTNGAMVIPISGYAANTELTHCYTVTGLTASVDGTICTIGYTVANGSSTTIAKQALVITYLVIT